MSKTIRIVKTTILENGKISEKIERFENGKLVKLVTKEKPNLIKKEKTK